MNTEGAILVGLDPRRASKSPAEDLASAFTAEESLEELAVLAQSAGAAVLAKTLQTREAPDAATLVGRGKVQEIAEQAEAFQAGLVVFDHDLTPTQLRNLQKALPCRVLDRTQLILDIFAKRARTREGQMQVELAQLNYLLPRLAGFGVTMSRLGGGIGTRGPGETKLETDRRRIRERIGKVQRQLEGVRSHRSVQRKQRQAVPLATVSLVGYTNAGKSTLFNRLTGAAVLADARMFATLDPTVRHIVLPSHRRALLSDTVGFIRNLPTTLVKAFRATLEEVTEASLLLHLVDASSPHAAQLVAHVMRVIAEIGAGPTPQILVLTKTDLLEDRDTSALARRILAEAGSAPGTVTRTVAVSARAGVGLEELAAAIDEMLPVDRTSLARFHFPMEGSREIHLLHEYGRVIEEKWTEDGCEVTAETPESVLIRLRPFVVKTLTPAEASGEADERRVR